MSRYRTVTRLALATGLLTLAACAGGGATLVAPPSGLKVPAWARTTPTLAAAAPRLKVPLWAQAAPLSERQAARLIYEHGARRSGEVALERVPVEVKLVFGAFTRPYATEAIAAVQTGLLGTRAWQAWLLEWGETGWQAVRPVASNCGGQVEKALLDRAGPATLLVRDSCARFGQEEGQIRLIALGPSDDKVLFAARERSGAAGAVRHTVWLTGFDENGQAEVVDLAFTESRGKVQSWTRSVITSTVTTYRPAGERLIAVRPAEADTSERVAFVPSY